MMKYLINKVAILILMGSLSEAKLPSCEEQVKAYNTYEVLEKGKIIERISIFELQDWSPHSSFEGLVTKEKDTTILIEVVLGDKVQKRMEYSFPLSPWSGGDSYNSTSGLDGKKIFNEWANGAFKIRLMKAGKPLCESQFKIWPQH